MRLPDCQSYFFDYTRFYEGKYTTPAQIARGLRSIYKFDFDCTVVRMRI